MQRTGTSDQAMVATKFATLPWRFTSHSVVEACKVGQVFQTAVSDLLSQHEFDEEVTRVPSFILPQSSPFPTRICPVGNDQDSFCLSTS